DDEDNEGNNEELEVMKVKSAILNNIVPMMFIEDDELVGFEIDLLDALQEDQNIEIEYKELKFDGFFAALQANQVDMAVAGINVNDERKEIVNFSQPYLNVGLQLLVRDDSDIQNYEDLEGKTIVGTLGATTHEAAKELADEY